MAASRGQERLRVRTEVIPADHALSVRAEAQSHWESPLGMRLPTDHTLSPGAAAEQSVVICPRRPEFSRDRTNR